jgi:hypothetical protein
MAGRYGLMIMRALRAAGVATVVAIVGFVVVSLRWERHASARRARTNELPRAASHLRAVARPSPDSGPADDHQAGTDIP